MKSARTINLSIVGIGVAVLTVAACTHVAPVADPTQYMLDRSATHVWVRGPNNQEVELSHAKMINDTLSGFDGNHYYEVAMPNVKDFRASVPAPGRTALAVGSGVVVVGAVVAELTSTGSNAGCETLIGSSQGGTLYPGGPVITQGIYVPCTATVSQARVR